MDTVRGFAANTRRQRVRIVGQFPAGRSGNGLVVFADIAEADLRRFVLGEGKRRWSAGTARVIGRALRCYLQFRSVAGDPAAALAGGIPVAAYWRLATLPDVLSQAEIDQLLGSFGQPRPSAKRAYAMVRCLTDLGLRADEVARLRLEDVDWHAGTLRVAQGKSRCTDVLPLPIETARAIADYLSTERPSTVNRAVFVRHVAPYDEPIRTGLVQRAVRAAYRRCSWTRTRVHTLRHSVASRLLQQGTPLKEIANVLRHRSLDTSAIYAKIDDVRPAGVALPWPGRAPCTAPPMLSLAQEYLDERRWLGFALAIAGTQLLSFARFADRVGHRGPPTCRLMMDWAQREARHAAPITWSRRLETIRPFAKRRAPIDPGTEVPSTDAFASKRRRPTPHIYTAEEITALLEVASRLPSSGTLCPATYETFFGLVAATGLRLSKALRLRCTDLGASRGLLTVRQIKFCKSRLVPLNPTTAEALAHYLAVRQHHVQRAPDAPLFMSSSGKALTKQTVHRVFVRLRAAAHCSPLARDGNAALGVDAPTRQRDGRRPPCSQTAAGRR